MMTDIYRLTQVHVTAVTCCDVAWTTRVLFDDTEHLLTATPLCLHQTSFVLAAHHLLILLLCLLCTLSSELSRRG
jgi:hypothetical protein